MPNPKTRRDAPFIKRPEMRNCDECRFADLRDDQCRCAHGNKPVFVAIDALSSAPECTDEGQRPEMPTANAVVRDAHTKTK